MPSMPEQTTYPITFHTHTIWRRSSDVGQQGRGIDTANGIAWLFVIPELRQDSPGAAPRVSSRSTSGCTEAQGWKLEVGIAALPKSSTDTTEQRHMTTALALQLFDSEFAAAAAALSLE